MLATTLPECQPKSLRLADCSRRDRRWDDRRGYAEKVATLYQGTWCDPYGRRMHKCSPILKFKWIRGDTGEVRLKLCSAHFCRVRHCPVCQSRRQEMWQARFFKAIPKILEDYPTARYLYLTLTVRNPPVKELRKTLGWMNKSFVRLTKRKEWPALGWAKSVEVTRGKDDPGTAHPHYHVLMMVPGGYFSRRYINQKEFTQLWKECLRADYEPVVDVRIVRPRKAPQRSSMGLPAPLPDIQTSDLPTGLPGVRAAILETFKYSVKAEDLITSQDWLLEVTKQMHKTRAVALGGVFRDYLSEEEPEDLIQEEELSSNEQGEPIYFGWHERSRRYLVQDRELLEG